MGENLVCLGYDSGKFYNRILQLSGFEKKEVDWIDKKTTAFALMLLTVFAAVAGGIYVSAQDSESNSTTSDTNNSDNPCVISDDSQFWAMDDMIGPHNIGRGPPGFRQRFMGGMANVELSTEYKATVTNILNADDDVQKLLNEGYSIQTIRPIMKTTLEADGTLTTKATTAKVLLHNGDSGRATITVDLEQAKVTQIIILTRTVIDKTTS